MFLDFSVGGKGFVLFIIQSVNTSISQDFHKYLSFILLPGSGVTIVGISLEYYPWKHAKF